METLRRDGYTVLPNLLAPEQIEAVHRELAPYLQQKLMGRNEFEGLRSERVYAVLAKAPSLAPLIEHPKLLAIVRRAADTRLPAVGRDRDQRAPR